MNIVMIVGALLLLFGYLMNVERGCPPKGYHQINIEDGWEVYSENNFLRLRAKRMVSEL